MIRSIEDKVVVNQLVDSILLLLIDKMSFEDISESIKEGYLKIICSDWYYVIYGVLAVILAMVMLK